MGGVVYQIIGLCLALHYEEEFRDFNELMPLLSDCIVDSDLQAVELVTRAPPGVTQCNM